jgi:hypothetical protein
MVIGSSCNTTEEKPRPVAVFAQAVNKEDLPPEVVDPQLDRFFDLFFEHLRAKGNLRQNKHDYL